MSRTKAGHVRLTDPGQSAETPPSGGPVLSGGDVRPGPVPIIRIRRLIERGDLDQAADAARDLMPGERVGWVL